MKAKIIFIVALGTFALADEYTLAALKNIQQATVVFNKAMAGWNGGYLSALPILQQSRGLLSTLNAAASPQAKIRAAGAVCNLEVEQESLAVAQALARDVGDAVDTAINMKPKLEAIPVFGKRIGSMIFGSLHTASSELGDAFSPKASEDQQEMARSIVNQIDEHFARGIAAYA